MTTARTLARSLARFLYGPFLTWAILSALVLAFTSPDARAQGRRPAEPVAAAPYSPMLAAQRRELLKLVANIRVCMFDASTAMLRQGVTDRLPVTTYSLEVCGPPLQGYLMAMAGWSERDAGRLVEGMAAEEYEASLSWGRK